jgi:hypothetical protein
VHARQVSIPDPRIDLKRSETPSKSSRIMRIDRSAPSLVSSRRSSCSCKPTPANGLGDVPVANGHDLYEMRAVRCRPRPHIRVLMSLAGYHANFLPRQRQKAADSGDMGACRSGQCPRWLRTGASGANARLLGGIAGIDRETATLSGDASTGGNGRLPAPGMISACANATTVAWTEGLGSRL